MMYQDELADRTDESSEGDDTEGYRRKRGLFRTENESGVSSEGGQQLATEGDDTEGFGFTRTGKGRVEDTGEGDDTEGFGFTRTGKGRVEESSPDGKYDRPDIDPEHS